MSMGGVPQEKPTPLLLQRPSRGGHLRSTDGPRALEWDVAGAQPWPLVLVLPRSPLAREGRGRLGRAGSSTGGGRDRVRPTARSRRSRASREPCSGARSLGVFGELRRAAVALEQGV